MIWTCSSRSSWGSTDFTLARVPTGIKTGVETGPWSVCRTPHRAAVLESTVVTVNFMNARGVDVFDSSLKVTVFCDIFLQYFGELKESPSVKPGDSRGAAI